MNDIEIIYDCETEKFSLSIEEIYDFKTIDDKAEYLTSLTNCFEKFLISMGYESPTIGNPVALNKEGYCLRNEVLSNSIYPNFNCTAVDLLDLYIKCKFKVDCWLKHNIKEGDKD